MIDPDDLPDAPEWVPLDKYGTGIPVSLAAAAIVILSATYPGIVSWTSLTGYGRFGVAIMLTATFVLSAAAAYTYLLIDTSWWLQTEENDAQKPVSFGETDE